MLSFPGWAFVRELDDALPRLKLRKLGPEMHTITYFLFEQLATNYA